jgi:hypothetical protein
VACSDHTPAAAAQAQPEQLAHELNRVPADRSPHIETDDLDGDEAADQRQNAGRAKVDGADLGITELAQQIGEKRLPGAREGSLGVASTPSCPGPRTCTRVNKF